MSFIAACLAHGQTDAEVAVARLLDTTASWPSDGISRWHDDGFALGGRWLWLTPDAERDASPIVDISLGLALVADVRLDDRETLCQNLNAHHETPDSRLLLHAYARWGTGCLHHLHGDYAFVVADLARRTLFCARDALGVRPLYHAALANGAVACASDAGALRHLLDGPQGDDRHLDIPFVLSYLGDRVDWHVERTLDARIRKVPGGHSLLLAEHRSTLRRWWHPEQIRTVHGVTVARAAALMAPVVERAVTDRLRTSKPVALHLSGGLDSSLVSALAVNDLRTRGAPLAGAWSWMPPPSDDPQTQESSRVQTVARHLGLEVTPTPLSSADVRAYLALDPLDLPCENTVLHEARVVREAHLRGAGLILSGWGGDELLSHHGWTFFSYLFIRGRWLQLWRAFEASGLRSLRARLASIVVPLLGALRGIRFSGAGPPVLSAAWARRPRPLSGRVRLPVDHRQRMLANLLSGRLSARTESWAALSARNGVQHVYPLLDRRIVEKVLTLPLEVFSDGPHGRLLMRRLAEPWLPHEITRETDKTDSSRISHLHAQVTATLPLLCDALDSRRLPPSRTCFVDLEAMRTRMATPEVPASYRMLDALRFVRVVPDLDTARSAQTE